MASLRALALHGGSFSFNLTDEVEEIARKLLFVTAEHVREASLDYGPQAILTTDFFPDGFFQKHALLFGCLQQIPLVEYILLGPRPQAFLDLSLVQDCKVIAACLQSRLPDLAEAIV